MNTDNEPWERCCWKENKEIIVIDWKERDHEDVDIVAMEDRDCLAALRNCGLLKFFMTSGIRAQLDLLQYLINIWDTDRERFILGDQEIEIEMVEIYFISSL